MKGYIEMKTIKFFNKIALLIISACSLLDAAYSSPLTGLQECQTIKNSTKKAECFDRQTQKMIQEEAEKKKKEEEDKVNVAKIAAAAAAAAAEAEKVKISSSAKEVIRSLRKFENRIETGISYRDYPSAFAEARFDVKQFDEGGYSSAFPEFISYCLKAVENYEDAQAVWELKIKDSDRYNNDLIYSNWDLVNMVAHKYPSTAAVKSGRSMKASYAMQAIWSEASRNIIRAQDALLRWEKNK